MTAVEWLINELGEYFPHEIGGIHLMVEQAKEMEKQQHGKTWDAALDAGQSRAWNVMRAYEDFDDYFAETYGSKGSDDHIVDTNEMVSSQTEISDEEIEKEWLKYKNESLQKFMGDSMISKYIITNKEGFVKWYREQLKQKQ